MIVALRWSAPLKGFLAMWNDVTQAALSYALLFGGVTVFVLAARYYRVPENGANKDWAGSAAIASLITWMTGCGLVLMVHFAFSYSALAGVGIMAVSIVACVAYGRGLWRILGLHKMPPVVVVRMGEDGDESPEPPVVGGGHMRRAA